MGTLGFVRSYAALRDPPPKVAVAAWGALRAQRTRHWACAVISGAGCGLMVGLQPDRGAIASLGLAGLVHV